MVQCSQGPPGQEERTLRLQILGCQGPYPGPGGATSGYLLTGPGRPVLLELGSGILARLGSEGAAELGAVVLSHLHFDHCAEVPLLGYLREARRRAVVDLPPYGLSAG